MSSHTVAPETAEEKSARRKLVNALYMKYPFLKGRICPPGYVSNVIELHELPADFLQLPHQPDGSGVENIYFIAKDGSVVGRVGTWWQRLCCAIHWDYSRLDDVSTTLARLGKNRVDRVEYVVFYHPTLLRIYCVPPNTDLTRMTSTPHSGKMKL